MHSNSRSNDATKNAPAPRRPQRQPDNADDVPSREGNQIASALFQRRSTSLWTSAERPRVFLARVATIGTRAQRAANAQRSWRASTYVAWPGTVAAPAL